MACEDVCCRDAAPKETFTRFQLAAVIDSSIHRIWRLGWLAGLGWAGLAGWLAGWAGLGLVLSTSGAKARKSSNRTD